MDDGSMVKTVLVAGALEGGLAKSEESKGATTDLFSRLDMSAMDDGSMSKTVLVAGTLESGLATSVKELGGMSLAISPRVSA